MNVHVSYRLHKTPSVEKDVQHQIEKLQKRLQVFRPELIHLKGTIEENSARTGASVSLNLRLPSGQMAVQASAPAAAAAVKSAFEDLLQQVNKHKELLRSSHKWHRGRRGRSTRAEPRVKEVPFEQTLAAVFPPTISSDDVRSYVNANLTRLDRFVEREIHFREAQDLLVPDALCKEEVIDEAIAAALREDQEKPERLALEPWLYHLALQALERLSLPDGSNGNAVHLEESTRVRNVKASDEAEMQFHQPDEAFTAETVIADNRVATPEEIMASDELLGLISSALGNVGPGAREAFVLYAIEGFTVEEIVLITRRTPEEVVTSIAAAREYVNKKPEFARPPASRIAPRGVA